MVPLVTRGVINLSIKDASYVWWHLVLPFWLELHRIPEVGRFVGKHKTVIKALWVSPLEDIDIAIWLPGIKDIVDLIKLLGRLYILAILVNIHLDLVFISMLIVFLCGPLGRWTIDTHERVNSLLHPRWRLFAQNLPLNEVLNIILW